MYAELHIRGPNVCQVAAASDPDSTVTRVSQTGLPNDDGKVTVEFEVEDPSDDVPGSPVHPSDGVYRLKRPVEQGCACELVERYECPVRRAHAADGELTLTFYAQELRTVRQAVADLKETCDGVHLRRLYHSDDDEAEDLVYVDREMLTDRQQEVLRTAHEMGYFDHPKGANAGEVAASLDISSTTFSEHLSTAQAKLLDRLLDA